MAEPIRLFQNDRLWAQMGAEILELTNQSHVLGQAQNGDITRLLEQTLATRFRRRHCITTACGTDALALAISALNLPQHTPIAVSNYTFTATAHAVARAGHQVVPVDVDTQYCIDASDIKDVGAIIPVDLFGNLSDHAALEQLGVPIIVDAAQSFESQDHSGKFSAEYGIAACVSFSPSKTISSWGSGGAVLTDSDAIADYVRRSRLHGKLRNDDMAIAPGLNSMMSSMECASVLIGLKYASKAYQRRHDIAQYLIAQSRWPTAIDFTRVGNHTYSKLVFQSDDRASVIKKFKDQAIDCVVHYNNLVSDEPLYSSTGQYYSKNLRDISFTVPNQHTLTDAEVERIAQGLK